MSAVLFFYVILVFSTGQAIAGWEQVGEITGRISEPKFPERDFNITDYGATGDGQADCTEAFEKAITAANKAGGGRVGGASRGIRQRSDSSEEQRESSRV